MKYFRLFKGAGVAQTLDSVDLEHAVTSPNLVAFIVCLGIGAFILFACYIFYPAYINVGGGLGCTTTILSGEGGSDKENVLSFVIPAYNEAERLPVMLDATIEYLDEKRNYITQLIRAVKGQKKDWSDVVQCEFIIVDDGSADDTEKVVRKYAESVKSGDTVKLISMHKNCGKGGAVKTGMLQSSGQLCLMVDADGATDISDGLPKVLKSMKSLISENKSNNSSFLPPAAVFGSRAHLEKESTASRSKIRTFLMHAFHFFVKTLCSPRIQDTQCGFKLFTRSAVVLLFTNLHLRRWAFDTEAVVIAEKLGVSLSEVGVIWHEVDGSKLDAGKVVLAIVSLGMLRDMVCVRMCYLLGIWKLGR
eukprot:CAMPEP_0183767044 /NCGR_PEP_ID=MMETSP0739-20130205/11950_1 /TAXON_ID=385413 /ORGANISM="Thalassiosira miniscula, Strain CCMP1093" /LENGTH=361 /DNA_ID=CAMNT_0026005913 /DNA_START=123 /DNA_END=1208 /DNA_ORIENTATION=-